MARTDQKAWSWGRNINNMENIGEGWLYHEKGMWKWSATYVRHWEKLQLSCTVLEWSIEKWSMFATCIGTYEQNQLIFVDKSAVDHCTMYRGHAWAICGMKATRKTFLCWGKKYTYWYHVMHKLRQYCFRYLVLPSLSLEGVFHCNIVEGAFNTASFYKFIEHTLDQMQPFPAPNSVIVMDNWSTQTSLISLSLGKCNFYLYLLVLILLKWYALQIFATTLSRL